MNDAILRLKIILADTAPPIWRRVEVPAAMTLRQLHTVIQLAMGWDDDHLHRFHRGHDTLPARLRLDELAARGIKHFTYLYDMGDSWEHRIQLEKQYPAEPGASYPRFVDGAMCCPPEDVGGVPGFSRFLEAMADPRHPDHDEQLDWHGGPFDPHHLDPERININLHAIATRRQRTAEKHRT
jgi:Plasmid pRiA4b ORF-3-like protein